MKISPNPKEALATFWTRRSIPTNHCRPFYGAMSSVPDVKIGHESLSGHQGSEGPNTQVQGSTVGLRANTGRFGGSLNMKR